MACVSARTSRLSLHAIAVPIPALYRARQRLYFLGAPALRSMENRRRRGPKPCAAAVHD
ncbi:hypothetical protein CBM2633_B90381 [Cupriavidus taiwanensis]|nr:hypothetical protein CBM2633_B90381 [Cupriavidus taiwanensis]